MLRIEISIPEQVLRLIDADTGELVRTWPVSTSKYGLGSEEGSNRTPLGIFAIAQKIGHGAESGTIFRSREPAGMWLGGLPGDDDFVLTRILWLDGKQEHNANTHARYIYIHGTNQENLIGTPASHGCVRMRNLDVMDLFDRVDEGTEVVIGGDQRA
jgi:L,D-transpeptidase YbiS